VVLMKASTPYLANMHPGTVLDIRELSTEEHALFGFHVSRIVTDYQDSQLFLAAYMNCSACMQADITYAKQCAERLGATPSLIGGERIKLDMSRHIMNLLSSVRTALDQTECNLKRRYSAESERYRAFERATNRAYDGSFAYRFLYKLRNFVQHCGLPIGRIGVETRASESATSANDISQTLKIEFSRDSLLSDYDSWGPLKSELAGLPEYFPIRPLITEMMTQIENIQITQIHANSTAVIESVEWLDRLLEEARLTEGTPSVAVRRPPPAEGGDYILAFQHFPFELMDMLRKSFGSRFPSDEQRRVIYEGTVTQLSRVLTPPQRIEFKLHGNRVQLIAKSEFIPSLQVGDRVYAICQLEREEKALVDGMLRCRSEMTIPEADKRDLLSRHGLTGS
jgi:hypothetical protein